MVHGNVIGLMAEPRDKLDGLHDCLKPAISHQKGRFEYHLQRPNDGAMKVQLIFTNPLDRDIEVNVQEQTRHITPRSFACIEVPPASRHIEIVSDFVFPRPLVICQKGQFIDCHHG